MKGFMKMFEEIMVAVAFAEAGMSVLFLQHKNTLYKELGGRNGTSSDR